MAEEFQGTVQDPEPSAFGSAQFEPSGSEPLRRRDAAARILRGRGPIGPDPRKFKYDALRGKGRALPFETSRDDRMSAEEAGAKLDEIHLKFGLAKETEDVLYAFDSALWFCHTVNGASTLVPGRSKFSVPGRTQVFDYANIRDLLGPDLRRFFRAFADDITEVNIQVLRDYDPYDPVKSEKWGWLMDVAYARGLSRFPQLAHDSADACLKLSPVERQALHTSKTIVIGGTPNAADRMKPDKMVSSADRYDSSVGTHY